MAFQKKAIVFALVLLTLGVASIAYYYVIALPRHNAARLRLDQQKFDQEKESRERKDREEYRKQIETEAAKAYSKSMLESCLNYADEKSETYVLMNGGQKTSQGTINAPQNVWDEAARQKKADKDECYRKYK